MKYEIIKGSDAKGFFIRVRSLNKAKHFAVHRTYLKREHDGKTITQKITEKNSDIIIKSIESKGITEGFIIVDNDKGLNISPADITHKLQEVLEICDRINVLRRGKIVGEEQPKKTDKQKEAEAILNALKNQEKINQKFQIKKARSKKMEKDW